MLENLLNEDMGKLILRLTVAVLTLFHGIAKAMHPESIEFIGGLFENIGLPAVTAYTVFIGQIIAPLMVILGYYNRIGAALITFTMLVAVLLVHTGHFITLTPQGGWGLELQAFYFFGALSVVFSGSGKYAVKAD